MKKLYALFFALTILLTSTSAFAMSSRPQVKTCETMSWTCQGEAINACWQTHIGNNMNPQTGQVSPENQAAYRACWMTQIQACAAREGCDVKKWFPTIF